MRDETFDIAKGICILLVVVGHMANQVFGMSISLISMFHMPVFIFISGQFFRKTITKYSYETIIKNKAITLLIPYFIWSFVSLFFNGILLILNGYFSVQTLWGETVSIFFYARSVWFLIVLFIIYLVFILGHFINEKINTNTEEKFNEKQRKYFLMAIEMILWICFLCFIPETVFSLYKFNWLFPFFILGYMNIWENIDEQIDNKPWIGVVCIIVFFVGYISVNVITDLSTYFAYSISSFKEIIYIVLCSFISLLGVISCIVVSKIIRETKIGMIFSSIGKITIEIYVLHMFFVKAVQIVIDRPAFYGLYGGLITPYLYSFIFAAGIIAIIYFMNKLFFSKISFCQIIFGKVKKKEKGV